MSFKLQQASLGGDWRLAGKQVIYQPITTWSIDDASSINTLLLQVEGMLENSATKFLLDSGDAISVVRHDHLSLDSCSKIDPDVLPAVGADGNLLDMLGQVTLPRAVGSKFQVVRPFIDGETMTTWPQLLSYKEWESASMSTFIVKILQN